MVHSIKINGSGCFPTSLGNNQPTLPCVFQSSGGLIELRAQSYQTFQYWCSHVHRVSTASCSVDSHKGLRKVKEGWFLHVTSRLQLHQCWKFWIKLGPKSLLVCVLLLSRPKPLFLLNFEAAACRKWRSMDNCYWISGWNPTVNLNKHLESQPKLFCLSKYEKLWRVPASFKQEHFVLSYHLQPQDGISHPFSPSMQHPTCRYCNQVLGIIMEQGTNHKKSINWQTITGRVLGIILISL